MGYTQAEKDWFLIQARAVYEYNLRNWRDQNFFKLKQASEAATAAMNNPPTPGTAIPRTSKLQDFMQEKKLNQAVVIFNADNPESVLAASMITDNLGDATTAIHVHNGFTGTWDDSPEMFKDKLVIEVDFGFDVDKESRVFGKSTVLRVKSGSAADSAISKIAEGIYENRNPNILYGAGLLTDSDIPGESFITGEFLHSPELMFMEDIREQILNASEDILKADIGELGDLTHNDLSKRLLDIAKSIRDNLDNISDYNTTLLNAVGLKLQDDSPWRNMVDEYIKNIKWDGVGMLPEGKTVTDLYFEEVAKTSGEQLRRIYDIPENTSAQEIADMLKTRYANRADIIKKIMRESEQYVDILTDRGYIEKVRVFHVSDKTREKYIETIRNRLRYDKSVQENGLFFEVHETKPGTHRVVVHSTSAADANAIAKKYGGGIDETAAFTTDNLDEILRPHGKVWYQRVAKGESFFAAKTQAEMIFGENSPFGVMLRTFVKNTVNEYIDGTGMSDGDRMLARAKVVSKIDSTSKKIVKFAAEHPIGWYAAAATTTALLIGTLRGAEFALTSRSLDKHRESKSYPTDQEYEGNPALDNWRKSIKHQVW